MLTAPTPPVKLLFAVAICLTIIGGAFAWRHAHHRSAGSAFVRSETPRTILWAWERPEDLSYINPQTTGVAFLAKTLTLRGSNIDSKPRLQPLQVPAGAIVIPVVRIEVDRNATPSFSSDQISKAADQIIGVSDLSKAPAIQIDFDATTSQRQFYKSLLSKVRESLPPETWLSITSLGSWCEGDRWIEDLPIDEAVPMLFRMGVDRKSILSSLSTGGLASARCQDVAGISVDEPINNFERPQRLYVFNPKPWTSDSVKTLLETQHR